LENWNGFRKNQDKWLKAKGTDFKKNTGNEYCGVC
jgi:hypothetical protein